VRRFENLIALDPDFPYSGLVACAVFPTKKQGTLDIIKAFEHLANRGKFLGVLLLIVMAIVPVYLCSDLQTRFARRNIDMGSTIGSYFGLVFLITYSAIRILLLPYQTIKS
jgi:hypothetical protein